MIYEMMNPTEHVVKELLVTDKHRSTLGCVQQGAVTSCLAAAAWKTTNSYSNELFRFIIHVSSSLGRWE